MTTRNRTDDIVEQYLGTLDAALQGLPDGVRRQLVEEVAGHITMGRAVLDPHDELGLRSLLDRVGDPDEIAAEAITAEAIAPDARTGERPMPMRRMDPWVPWILLLGGVVGYLVGGAGAMPLPLILGAAGWLAGVVALGSSSVWGVRDKVLGTFVLPGGLFGIVGLVARPISSGGCSTSGGPGRPTVEHCTGGTSLPPALGILVFAVLLVAPVVTAVHLDRVRRRSALGPNRS